MRLRNIALAVTGAVAAVVAVKHLTRAATVNWEDIAASLPHSEHSIFVNVDGARIHFQAFGDPKHPTIILIHGYTASSYAWRSAAPALADNGYHVIAIDLIGYGFSEKPRWFDYSIQSQARMIARFLNRMGIGRATLVGSSYGGAVAATIALDYAERVERLVLVGAVCDDRLRNHPLLRLAAIRGVGEMLTPFFADSRSLLRRRMHGTLAQANHALITQERIESVLRPLRAADAHHSLLITSRNWRAERIARDAHLIGQQTLIIWGEDDTVTPLEDAYLLYDRILNSRLIVFKNCGHVPMEEKCDSFVAAVSDFLQA